MVGSFQKRNSHGSVKTSDAISILHLTLGVTENLKKVTSLGHRVYA